jgi:hypothetical protein
MTDLNQALANSKSDDWERGEPATTSIQPLQAHSGAKAELCLLVERSHRIDGGWWTFDRSHKALKAPDGSGTRRVPMLGIRNFRSVDAISTGMSLAENRPALDTLVHVLRFETRVVG